MKLLEEKILSDGIAVDENILKVDSFINHQVDPMLMTELGRELAGHFREYGITKVATIESSGIAPALTCAAALNVPMIILKKQPSKTLNSDLYQTIVTSYTKGTSYELTLSRKFVGADDHILIVDDFLANGEAATGALRLIRNGYLRRESLDSDRRYKKLVLTEQTLAIKDDITSRVNEYMHSMFVGIADEDLKVFEKVIMQMAENTK